MATRICANCKNPMGNSWSSIWVTETNSIYCHSKCLKEYNHKLVDKIITNAVKGIRKPSDHDMVIFDRWYKKEFAILGEPVA